MNRRSATDTDSPLSAHDSSRRTFLRTAGTLLALPAFESLSPLYGSVPKWKRGEAAIRGIAKNAATTATGAPLRMAFFFIPNGVNTNTWRALSPEGGTDLAVGSTDLVFNQAFSNPQFEAVRDKLQFIRNLDLYEALKGQDGPGDHARSNATFLTVSRAFKTGGANIKLGVSVDQIAAMALEDKTRIASLQLGTESARRVGTCDSGYSCAYQYNISWASPKMPIAPEYNPRIVFEKLYGAGSPKERQANLKKRLKRQKSILDGVLAEAKRLQRKLGRNDQGKLDEYLTSVRSIERQIEKAEKFKLPYTDQLAPEGIPLDHSEHIRLMMDLMVLAFQTDSTRVISMPFAYEGSQRTFPETGVSEGHHSLSHHQRDEEKLAKITKIDRHYSNQFAYFLEKMESVRDLDGKSLLDNSMVLYGGGIADGNRHNHLDLPIVLAGGAGGKLQGNRALTPEAQSLGNLYESMLDLMGIDVEFVGGSSGKLKGLV